MPQPQPQFPPSTAAVAGGRHLPPLAHALACLAHTVLRLMAYPCPAAIARAVVNAVAAARGEAPGAACATAEDRAAWEGFMGFGQLQQALEELLPLQASPQQRPPLAGAAAGPRGGEGCCGAEAHVATAGGACGVAAPAPAQAAAAAESASPVVTAQNVGHDFHEAAAGAAAAHVLHGGAQQQQQPQLELPGGGYWWMPVPLRAPPAPAANTRSQQVQEPVAPPLAAAAAGANTAPNLARPDARSGAAGALAASAEVLDRMAAELSAAAARDTGGAAAAAALIDWRLVAELAVGPLPLSLLLPDAAAATAENDNGGASRITTAEALSSQSAKECDTVDAGTTVVSSSSGGPGSAAAKGGRFQALAAAAAAALAAAPPAGTYAATPLAAPLLDCYRRLVEPHGLVVTLDTGRLYSLPQVGTVQEPTQEALAAAAAAAAATGGGAPPRPPRPDAPRPGDAVVSAAPSYGRGRQDWLRSQKQQKEEEAAAGGEETGKRPPPSAGGAGAGAQKQQQQRQGVPAGTSASAQPGAILVPSPTGPVPAPHACQSQPSTKPQPPQPPAPPPPPHLSRRERVKAFRAPLPLLPGRLGLYPLDAGRWRALHGLPCLAWRLEGWAAAAEALTCRLEAAGYSAGGLPPSEAEDAVESATEEAAKEEKDVMLHTPASARAPALTPGVAASAPPAAPMTPAAPAGGGSCSGGDGTGSREGPAATAAPPLAGPCAAATTTTTTLAAAAPRITYPPPPPPTPAPLPKATAALPGEGTPAPPTYPPSSTPPIPPPPPPLLLPPPPRFTAAALSLTAAALTCPSCRDPGVGNYDRLEFLGDAALKLLAQVYVFLRER